MATTLTCPNCGAPVRWKGEAPVVACRYCDTHVATGTGKKTQEPTAVRSQMRPRNVAAVSLMSVFLPMLLVGISGLVALIGAQSGPGGMLGPSFADVAALTLDHTSSELGQAIGDDAPSVDSLVIYFSGSDFDYVVFGWEEDHPGHVSSFGLYASEPHPQMQTIVHWMEHYLGPRFGASEYGGWTWRWADAHINVAEDGTSLNYHCSPEDDPDWKYRSELMWSVVLASATGQDLKLDRETRKRWLGLGYLLSELALLDVTTEVDDAVAEVRSRFPAAAVEQSYSLEFEFPVDHPWFRSMEIGWENADGGQIEDVTLWPPARANQFPDQRAIRDCLEKTYGKAEASEVDHLKKQYNYSWDPDDMGRFTVHDHLLSIYLVESSWRETPAPSQKEWVRLMRTLDGCSR